MSTSQSASFFTAGDFKPPGWTGTLHGLNETYARTPACAQLMAKRPQVGEFLHTRELPPQTKPDRDPCNFPREDGHTGAASILWPPLQSQGRQEPFKPPHSNIEFGDPRIKPYLTSYAQSFAPPLPEQAVVRSPLRNKSLTTSSNLKEEYKFAMQRIGEKRLKDIIAHMRERIHGRIGNKSDNAFKLRKFAKMYDATNSGLISLEDFRVTTEASGMQLDDDSLLALFSKYDVFAEGRIPYAEIMRDLLDEDALCLYLGGVSKSVI